MKPRHLLRIGSAFGGHEQINGVYEINLGPLNHVLLCDEGLNPVIQEFEFDADRERFPLFGRDFSLPR